MSVYNKVASVLFPAFAIGYVVALAVGIATKRDVYAIEPRTETYRDATGAERTVEKYEYTDDFEPVGTVGKYLVVKRKGAK